MEVERYILESTVVDGVEQFSLARIVMYDDKGLQGEEYYDGEWHQFDGALSYMHDPSPGDFIDEARAREIMTIIDKGSPRMEK